MNSKNTINSDFCVIGAGAAGLSFASGVAQMGASVVLLEKSKMGGDCLNYGCIPSKSLIAAAKYGYNLGKKSRNFGWIIQEISIDFQKVYNHIHSVINSIAYNDSIERFEKLGVQVILEEGKFLNQNTVETQNNIIKAKYFIIATGSKPFIPPINGLDSIKYYTNESIFDLQELPKYLVVIGGGPIGIELAQSFNRLGSQVTILEGLTILPKDDSEIVSRLKKFLIDENITIHEHVKINSIINNNNGFIEIQYQDEHGQNIIINPSHLLVATGRRANIHNLNLDAANVKISPRGIEVNDYLRTSNPKIYAIGDCIGGYQFTHAASYHSALAIRNIIFHLRSKIQTQTIPWVTYTDPELAHVGFSEKELIDQKIAYKKLQMGFQDNDRAQTEKRTDGEIKVLVSPKGYILGVTILGIQAGELIYPWVIAIQNKLKISAIASSIAPYPTLNDINKRVASSYYSSKIFSPMTKKIVKFIMKWTW